MTKKHSEQKISVVEPAEQEYQLYSARSSDNILPAIRAFVSLAIGLGFLFEKLYIIGLLVILFSVWIVIAMLTAVQSARINGEKIIIDYAIQRDIFSAVEIESIDWKVAITQHKWQRYSSHTFLLIKTTGGKRPRYQGHPIAALIFKRLF